MEKTLTNPVYFSHLPKAGISFAATVESGKLYIAACFVNDGTNLNGRLNKDRRDKFSRNRAREILKGRILSVLKAPVIYRDETGMQLAKPGEKEPKVLPYIYYFDVTDKFNLANFMSEFRKAYKPIKVDGTGIGEAQKFLVEDPGAWEQLTTPGAWMNILSMSIKAIAASYLPRPPKT